MTAEALGKLLGVSVRAVANLARRGIVVRLAPGAGDDPTSVGA